MLKRAASWLLKLALTGGSIWYLQQKVDLQAAWDVGKHAAPAMLVAAMLLQGIQVAICAIRWKMVLRAIHAFLPFSIAAELFMIGNFFGQILPGAVGGDAVRMWKTHRAGLSLSNSINSVALERVVTVFGLVVLVSATEPLLLGRLSDTSGKWVFPLLTAGGIAGILALTLLDRLPSFLGHLAVVRGFMALAGDARRVFLNPVHAGPTLLVTVLGHINLALVVWVLGLGVGAQVTALDCIVLVPPVVLVATLPLSIAGWGVRETAMITVFGFIGVGTAQATAMSVLFGVSGVLIALPGGLLWLFSRDKAQPSQELG